MRSRKEQRKQPTSKEGSRQRVAVKPPGYAGAQSSLSAQLDPSSREGQSDLLEQILQRDNLLRAYKRVKQNKGAPGVDGVTVEQLQEHLWQHWDTVLNQLLSGTYQPTPVKRWKFQTRRRGAVIGHTDCNGPPYPTSPSASNDPHL